MSPVEARVRFYARIFAEYEMRLHLEELRTEALTERMAMAELDIEKIQGMIGNMNCAPTVQPLRIPMQSIPLGTTTMTWPKITAWDVRFKHG